MPTPDDRSSSRSGGSDDGDVDVMVDAELELRPGATIVDVRLVEPIETGAKITCWRGQRRGGGSATVHALQEGASEREQSTFHLAATRLASLWRGRRIAGVVPVVRVVPGANVYLTELSASGSMADLPVLGWKLERKQTFIRRVAGVLAALHRARMFHGCIKPGNVLLDEELAPVLADVGALVLEDSFPGTAETRHEYWAYAAREVRQGQAPDARSDVFSLGRLLYFALAEAEPDDPDDDLPLLARLRDAPPGLVKIVRRATVRDPAGRYGSIDELLEDLGRFGHAEQVGLSHPEGPEDRRAEPGPAAAAAGAGKEKPADKQKTVVALGPSLQAVTSVRGGPSDDPFVGHRATIGVALGLAMLGAGGWLGYRQGFANNLVTALGVLGAAAASLALPVGQSRAWLGRLGWAALAVVAMVAIDPGATIALAGRRAKFRTGTPQQRAALVVALARAGHTEFESLELDGADFSGRTLTGLDLSGARLRSARFGRATLTRCTLVDADLTGADFAGADLAEVDVGSAVGWRDTRCDEATVMPPRWHCNRGIPGSDDDIPGVLPPGVPRGQWRAPTP